MMSNLRFAALAALALLLPALLGIGCGGGSEQPAVYHCPMHPTYVADHPGDCPICNMKLVPVTESTGGASGSTSSNTAAASTEAGAVRYHCPMHPTYVSDRPGECPICHMALVPIEEAPAEAERAAGAAVPPGSSVVQASPEAVQLAGVQTAVAVLDTVQRSVRAVGIVRPDETRVRQVNTRVSGWVEKLSVNFTGQFVREGDPLLTIYSPELLASQDEYLNALEAARRFEQSDLPEVRKGSRELLASSRARLLLLGVPEKFIRKLEIDGTASANVVLDAPSTGYVSGKDIFAGAQIEPGMTLFTISDLSRVWIEADVYEYEAPAIARGAEVTITLPNDPAFRQVTAITYVYPTLDPMTRTLRVRAELPNPKMTLKPDMFANVEIQVASGAGVVIPDDAILDSGTRKIVFVETAPGAFTPREIVLGVRSDGRAQILSGVAAGEHVVVRANFLLDSESRLRAAISGFTGGHAAHGGTPAGDAPADTTSGAGHGGHP